MDKTTFVSRLRVRERLAATPRRVLIQRGASLVVLGFLLVWARPVLSLLVMLGWTAVVLRVLGIRATLSARTLATYLIVGVLLELVVAPFLRNGLAAYITAAEWSGKSLLVGLLHTTNLGLILVPVILFLFRTRIHVMTSVTDAFLLAFATGIGTELPRLLTLTSLRSITVERSLFLLGDGYSYWVGLVALVLAVGLRFLRQRQIAFGLALVVFFYLANTGWMFFFLPPALFPGRSWLFHWPNPIWLSLSALVLSSFLETLWVGWRIRASATGLSAVPGTLRELFLALRSGAHMGAARLRRQHEIVIAEQSLSPDDPQLGRAAHYLEDAISNSEAQGGLRDPLEERDRFAGRRRVYRTAQAFLWVVIGFIFLVLPKLPLGASSAFWSLLTLVPPIPRIPTFLNILLMLVLVVRYLPAMRGAPASQSDADALLRFYGHRMILQLSLGAMFLVLANIDLLNFVGGLRPSPWLGSGLGQLELATLLLLFATAASGFAADPIPLEHDRADRREAVVRNASMLAQGLVVVWLVMLISELLLPVIENFLGGGGYVAAVTTAVGMGVLAFVIALLLRLPSTRLEDVVVARLARSPETA